MSARQVADGSATAGPTDQAEREPSSDVRAVSSIHWSFYEHFIRAPLRELAHRPDGQLPALDAMRTCAVLFVIFQHSTNRYLASGGHINLFARLPFVRGGFIGVDLFFVLSGYFIGKQLWREIAKTGTIHIGRFVLRRAFRIWPLYFFFLVFVLAVLRRGLFPLGPWWSDALFVTNYTGRGVVMGSWSLCTEEQFYILAPAILFFTSTRGASVASYRKYLVALLVVLPLIRALTCWSLTHDLWSTPADLIYNHIYTPFHTHADGLVMGLLLSNLDVSGRERCRQGFFASYGSPLAFVVVCLGLQHLQRAVFDITGVTLLFGSILWVFVAKKHTIRGLDSRVFYVISRLSFGMYLNHEYMQEFATRFTMAHVPMVASLPAIHNMVAVGVLVLLSVAVSTVTFCLIEHPFLELRGRVLRGKTRVHQEMAQQRGHVV